MAVAAAASKLITRDIEDRLTAGIDRSVALLVGQRRLLQEEPHLAIGHDAEHAVLAGGLGRGVCAQGDDARPIEADGGGVEEHQASPAATTTWPAPRGPSGKSRNTG